MAKTVVLLLPVRVGFRSFMDKRRNHSPQCNARSLVVYLSGHLADELSAAETVLMMVDRKRR